MRQIWRALTLRFPVQASAALARRRPPAAVLSAIGSRVAGAPHRADRAAAGELAAARAAGAADGAARSRTRSSRAREEPPSAGALPRRAADRLRAGSGLSGRQPRHRRRAARQRLHRRDAAGAAVLRLAARAQRRPGRGPGAGAPADRPAAAGSLRRDHQQRRRLRLAPAPLRAAARGRPGSTATARAAWDTQGARRARVAGADRLPAAAAAPFDDAGQRHVPRVLSPGARAEGRARSRAPCCG